jgi:hypothetical protein
MSNDIIKSYKTKLTDAETKLNMVLNEMIKSYPNYKLYPDVNEIQNIHENNTFKLEDVKKEIFLLKSSIHNDNEKIKKIIENKNKELKILEDHNKKLKKRYNTLIDSDQSSIGLRAQVEDQYRKTYLSFILLATFTLSIGAIGVIGLNKLRLVRNSNLVKYH